MLTKEMQKIKRDELGIVQRHLKELPVKLGALASDLGVRVTLSSLPTGISGQIKREGVGYEIKINRHESRERQRFTLAHELSHFLLHREVIDSMTDGLQDNVLYRSGAPNVIEYEANRLAAELVMPKDLVDEQVRQYQDMLSEEAIEDLARRFGVSKAAMEIRVAA